MTEKRAIKKLELIQIKKDRQWNKDKPRGERKFNKGKGKNFRKEDGATTNPDRKATKKPTKRSPTKYGKSNTKFRK